MTVYEALKLCGGVIEELENKGINPSDHKYVELFEDYRKALKRGEKVSYIVAVLAERYSVSERNVYGIVKRLGNDCKDVSPLFPLKIDWNYRVGLIMRSMRYNKYYAMLDKILQQGERQSNKKGDILCLHDEQMRLTPRDLLEIFEGYNIARKKLRRELSLFMAGERDLTKYREAGINWWDYCGQTLINSYPTYFEKLPALIDRINQEKRNSKNYVLHLGSTGVETNQAPCLSIIQFQLDNDDELVVSAYQRSSDANLGLPADIYHLYLIARQIEVPLKSITLTFGNVHIYDNNIERTRELLAGNDSVRFELNV